MGIRSKLKGAIKRAITGDDGGSRPSTRPATAPAPPEVDPSNAPDHGNLSGGEDVPWYLQDGDADGWDNTNAKDDLDED